MGVDVQAFVILGVKLPGDAIDDQAYDRLEPYIGGAPEAGDIIVVYDGMSGKYVVVGKRLAASVQTDGHFDEPIAVDVDVSSGERNRVSDKIRELFPDQPWQPLSVLVVSHYS